MGKVTFKKQENGKFKAFDKETGEPVKGFEDKEFTTAMEGAKFFKEETPAEPKRKMFKIIIDEQDNADKNGDVFVTDGRGAQFQIKRGVEAEVPEGVVNVLKESVYDIVSTAEDGSQTTRSVKRFAFRVIGEA